MAGQDFVSSLLQSCHGRVSLTIQHVTNTQLYPSAQSPTKKTGAPPLYNPSSPPIRLQRPLDPPPYASSEATPMRLDPAPSSAYQDNSYSPRHHHGVIQQTQYRDVVGQSLPESSLSPAPPSNSQYGNRDIGREGYQSDHHRTNLRYVKLTRGPKGLGFSVAGGKGSPNGDLPICIRSVIPECTAARDGRIRQGDVILSVNGISFENISHKVAVETLTRFRGDITLKLCSP